MIKPNYAARGRFIQNVQEILKEECPESPKFNRDRASGRILYEAEQLASSYEE